MAKAKKKTDKKNKKTETKASGDQLDLIDVGPENAKLIIRVARLYKKSMTARIAMLQKEVEHKQTIKDHVKKAGLRPFPDGRTKFTFDGVTITITPCDEKVTVTENESE